MGKRGPKKAPACLVTEECVRIQNRVKNNREWLKVVDRIRNFMNHSRRNWPNAVLYLIERGLEYVEKEELL